VVVFPLTYVRIGYLESHQNFGFVRGEVERKAGRGGERRREGERRGRK